MTTEPSRTPLASCIVSCAVLVLTAPACGGNAGHAGGVELSSPEVTIAIYQDTMAAPKGVSVTYPGARLTVQVPAPADAPWLSVDVSDHGGSAILQIFADVRKVVPGTYTAVLTLAPAAGDAVDLPIAFTVWEPFRLAAAALDVSTTLDGGANAPGATLGILGAQSHWEVRGAPPWLVFARTAGDGSQQIAVSCDKSAIASPGILAANLQITDTVGGRAAALAVRCIAESHRLVAARHGVAFSQFPNAAALAADVVVDHNGSAAIDWSASATVPWLSVTAGGRSGQAVHIAADPTGLAPGLHLGAVAIRPSAPTIARTETIRVGLHVSSTALPDPLIQPFVPGDLGDPIRPDVYLVGSGPRVEARNLYTGGVDKVYPLPAAAQDISSLCDVSDDGKYLYLNSLSGYDGSNPFAYYARDVWRVNLDDETEPATLLFTERATINGYSNSTFPIRYLSSNGVPLLFNPVGRLHRADTGEVLTSFLWNWTGSSDHPYEVYEPTLVSLDRSGKHMALTDDPGLPGVGLNLYAIEAHDTGSITASVTLETSTPYQGTLSLRPGILLLGGDLDRIYVRFGYFEKVDTSWVYHEKFQSEQRFLDAGNGVLFGTGADSAHDHIVGQYTKDGDLIRKLSPASGPGWNLPLLSSDGLMVFASTADINGSVTYGFRR